MTFKIIPALAMLALAAACSPAPAQDAPVAPDRVTLAVTMTKAMDAKPDKADSILAAYNYTTETFERLLREIAEDSTMSVRYTVEVQ